MLKKRILGLVLALALTALLAVPAGADDTEVSGFVCQQPTVSSVNEPNDNGDPGETLDVTINGENFIQSLGEEQVQVELEGVSFGEGITVNSITVSSAIVINANITIDAEAAPGLRDITVTIGGVTGTGIGLFTVNGTITVNAPETIPLGVLIPNTIETGNIVLTDLVETNLAEWQVNVKDNSNGGFLKNGELNLGSKFQIGPDTDSLADADVGFSFNQTDTESPTLYWSQNVPAEADPGTYSITLTFTASAP